MTQKHLSKLSGISTSMISAIELGERHPTVPVLDALARALQVKVTIFTAVNFDYEEEP